MNLNKKKKNKSHYTVMLVSDTPNKRIKKCQLSPIFLSVALAVLVLVLTGGIGYIAYTAVVLRNEEAHIAAMSTKNEEWEAQITKLQTENTELSNKVLILSDTINQKKEQEDALAAEVAEQSRPSGFPLGGTATMEENTESTDPIVVFVANRGITVISSGNGTVLEVADDVDYGHVVKIDHGNGFVSIYRCASDAKVTQGDKIERGNVLFEMNEDEQKLGYQIMENEQYVNPMDVMEVYG